MKETTLTYLKTYIIAIAAFLLALFLVSCIPQSILKNNAYSGRENAIQGKYPLYRLTETNNFSTFIDVAADEVMIDLSYELGLPESSVINPVVFVEHANSVVHYGRYWHGYAAVIRPLLVITDQKGITTIMAIIVIALLTLLSVSLIIRKHYILALIIPLMAYMTYFNIVIKCLEYMFCMAIALGFSVYICLKKEIKNRYLMYFIIGMCVAYFDFLTFETLTLTLPLIIDISVHEDINIRSFLLTCINWGSGYILSMGTNYLLLICSGNDMTISNQKLIEKISSEYSPIEAIGMNLMSVRLMDSLGMWIAILLFSLFIIYIMGSYCRTNYYFFIITMIPIIRYAVLSGHSGGHFAFTYHALMGTLIAFGIIITSPIKFFVFTPKEERKKQKEPKEITKSPN
ncbi:MAG: hypothetical protein J5525_13015 [Lachnospiraceae bacterium]|nr:hypothetical protein [Lachnospiraceae bacterium]